MAVDRGYTGVYTFIGGIPEWRRFNYPMFIDSTFQKIIVDRLSPEEVFALLQEDEYYLLDVRPLDFERDASFITGSHHCPLVYLESRYKEIPRDREIIITDWAMRQSPTAAKYLIDNGYLVRGVLRGGMERWRTEDLPYEIRKVVGNVELHDFEDSSEAQHKRQD